MTTVFDIEIVVGLMKERIGIRTKTRDEYLTTIANSIIGELENEKGLFLHKDNPSHLMFVVDYSTWRYKSRDESGGLPRHLQFRLHNLIISNKDDD